MPQMWLLCPCVLFQQGEITAFHHAARQGDLELIREFIEVQYFSVDKEDKVKCYVLKNFVRHHYLYSYLFVRVLYTVYLVIFLW